VKHFATLVLVLLMGGARPTYAAHELVIIVSARNQLGDLDARSAQRLFLGLTVTHNDIRLRPILNQSDPQIMALFLQNIVSMSNGTYDRYILRLALLQGRTEPATYKNARDVIDAVASDPTAVSYVWAEDAARDVRVKTIRVVWHD
jgi:hypothetical protein